MPAEGYTIELTTEAETVYTKLADDADRCLVRGDVSNAKVTLFNMVEEALDTLIPHDPFNKSRALAGPLSNVYRIKKGRLRICYIGSSATRKIIVLYIATTLRKEGDRRDPYAVFTKLVKSGRYDRVFSLLGTTAGGRPARGKRPRDSQR